MSAAYAHTLPPPAGIEDWELLEAHLEKVAALAGEFCAEFCARDWGTTLGKIHDLGKLSADFQRYLRESSDADASEAGGRPGKVDHSTFGARYAVEHAGSHAGRVLAFCVAGHHAGLADAVATCSQMQRSSLQFRLSASDRAIPLVPLGAIQLQIPRLKLPFPLRPDSFGFELSFFTRMIFSALIDADRLATEAFCDVSEASARSHAKPGPAELLLALTRYLDNLTEGAEATTVNKARAEVLADCRNAAEENKGFFSLNVPTGGGKTLSSMDFALRHAVQKGMRRVVVAVPFTTIIEQTAGVYRKAFGSLAERGLIEHHSNLEPTRDTRANKLATENWDAPIVVTTNVQLFESLFASKTTPCRKLHRLANSVIVLDEAQTLPIEFLTPTLRALQELVDHYGCSIVLCTATQPALEKNDDFQIGLENVRSIIGDAPKLFHVLKRTTVRRAGKLTDAELTDRLGTHRSALCVVNTKRHAATVFDLLKETREEGAFHLSTNMCAAHRRDVFTAIRQRLRDKSACRVVSTQLVEAGVDLDFDVVYRAPAGFDSIAQAAGRCNREGRLERGDVWMFETDALPPRGLLRQSAQTALELLNEFEDPIAPDAIEKYFQLLYWKENHRWDKHEIMAQFRANLREPELSFQFKTAAERYRLIRDDQTLVLVVYDETSRALCDRLALGDAGGFLDFRAAQQYLVGVRERERNVLYGEGAIEEHSTGSGIWLLRNDRAYTADKGLTLDAAGYTASDCIV